MNTRSKSTLFLIEQLIVIAVFALCAAACVAILAYSFFTAEETRDMSNALLRAENAAEAFKATGGDLERVANIIGDNHSVVSNDSLMILYDSNWQFSDYVRSDDGPAYLLIISILPPTDSAYSSLIDATVSVYKRDPGIILQQGEILEVSPILSFPVVARNSMIGGAHDE